MTEQLAGTTLLNIKALAADAENSALTARLNTDMLVKAYIELQSENVKLRDSLERIAKVIGPVVPECSGCTHEWNMALRIAQDAMRAK